jgi:Cu/Ag efflux pump CusA
MTAFSTIFGVFPLAFATGAGAASRISIGMAVLGGMLVSTLLSLYIVPVFYAIAKTFQLKLFKKSDQSLPQIKSPQGSNGQRIKIKSD